MSGCVTHVEYHWLRETWYTVLFDCFFFFFSSRRRHTRLTCDWSSDVCSSDLARDDKSNHKIGPGRRRPPNQAGSDQYGQVSDRVVAREQPNGPHVGVALAMREIGRAHV